MKSCLLEFGEIGPFWDSQTASPGTGSGRGAPRRGGYTNHQASRDGRAGGAPLTPRRAPGAPKWARGLRGGTKEIAQSSWYFFFYGGAS
jgi:hypothetical protein